MDKGIVSIPVRYQLEWQDGFGARGWKLNSSLSDPAVIAATAETGDRIPTSVLVHDILDHYLCGLPLSGHRNEATALYQLAMRTGSDPISDFSQMVDEDLLRGCVSGEPLSDFLPEWMLTLVPDDVGNGIELIQYLVSKFSREALRQVLIMRFVEIGAASAIDAKSNFERTGLDYASRQQYGKCLQNILSDVDGWVVEQGISEAEGVFSLARKGCSVKIFQPVPTLFEADYAVD